MATKRITSRYRALIVLAGVLLGAAALTGLNKNTLGLFHDDGIYVVVAKSLAEGGGYRITSLPTAPHQTKYPFLYSYLLSGVWQLKPNFPENIFFIKAVNVAILVALFFTAVFFYWRSVADAQGEALLYALLVTANPIVFSFTDVAVSDLLLMFLALGALALVGAETEARYGVTRLVSIAALSGLACLTRPAGLPLVFAGALHAFARNRLRGLGLYVFTVLIIVAPWFLWRLNISVPPEDSLLSYYLFHANNAAHLWVLEIDFPRQIEIALANLRYLGHTLELLFVSPLAPGLDLAIYGVMALGIFLSLRKHDSFFWSFVLSYGALIVIWPFHPARYTAPLVPIVVLFFFRGMQGAQMLIATFVKGERLRRLFLPLAWMPLVLVLALNAVWLSSYFLIRDDATTRSLYGRRLPYGWSGFLETFSWIRDNTDPGSILATAYDPMYYLYTGRKAVRPALHKPETYFYPFGEAVADVGSVEQIKPQLASLGVDYLIVDPLDGYAERDATLRLFDAFVLSYGTGARLVFTSSDLQHRIYTLGKDQQ